MRADVIPQLADAGEVLEAIDPPDGVSLSVLIPNERGLEHALRHRDRFHEVNVFLSASETHNRKNVNRSIEESLTGLERVLGRARAEGLRCEGVISVAFGCPYEGHVPPERVFAIARRLIEAGAEEIGFGDTTGMANPAQVRDYFPAARAALGDDVELTAHFHNTRGQGLANVFAAYEAGVRSFESSFGELGGCPVPEGATGNVATEDVVSMLHEMGAETGIDLGGAARVRPRGPARARPPARLAPADRGPGRLGQRPLNSGWRFSRNALRALGEVGRRGAALLRRRPRARASRRAPGAPRRPSPAWRARPRSARTRAARRRAARPPRRAPRRARRGWRARSARPPRRRSACRS